MKQHPILFSAPMVRAIQAGTKSQTRRVVKFPKKALAELDEGEQIELTRMQDGYKDGTRPVWGNDDDPNWFSTACPYGQVGDVLWVRETFVYRQKHDRYYYRADHADDAQPYCHDGWKPSIHMPYVAARLFLKITSVRVERLQDINLNDARAEGIVETWGDGGRSLFPSDQPHEYDNRTSVENYTKLWEMINGDDTWACNPWVWVVEFEPTDKPV